MKYFIGFNMPAGRPTSSGKSHNKASKTYQSTGKNLPRTSSSPSTSKNPIINYFKHPLEKDPGDEHLDEPQCNVWKYLLSTIARMKF